MTKPKAPPHRGKEKGNPEKEEGPGEDRISGLSDDILVSIISRLTVREATRTSILSTRWKHLCYYITRLNFGSVGPTKERINKNTRKFQKKKCPRRCVKWIHHFLDTHKKEIIIDEFRLKIPYILSSSANIDKWCKFAFSRGVEVFEIDLNDSLPVKFSYDFRSPIIHHSFCVETLINHKGPPLLGFRTVKSLSLSLVDVDDRGVELLVSNCDVLESLSIRDSRELNNVIVSGHTTLKHLDMCGEAIELIYIRDMINLVSFRHHRSGPDKMFNIVVENVPKLIEIDSGGPRETVLLFLHKLSSCLDQLVQVSLAIHSSSIFGHYARPPVLPILMNVNRVVVEVRKNYPMRIFDLISVVHESPLLHELHVQFGEPRIIGPSTGTLLDIPQRAWNLKNEPHHNLITVKFSGFCPYMEEDSQSTIAAYILKNALNLEKLIIMLPCKNEHIISLALAWQQLRGTKPHQFRGATPNSIQLVSIL